MPARPVGPWRTGDGPRPSGVPLPPARMPLLRGGRPRKAWCWVGVFAPEVLLCAAVARVGPAYAAWWAVWDREDRVLVERTRRTARGIRVAPGTVEVRDGATRIALELDGPPGIETVSPHGAQYAWTRKAAVRARGVVVAGSRRRTVDAPAVVDESAGYHARETRWSWSAGAGTTATGAAVAWNLVAGIHDDAASSERTIWVDGVAHHAGRARFAPGLDAVTTLDGGCLSFRAEAARARREDLRVVVSEYEQPFGVFAGRLPHAGELAEGFGVMERHLARW